MWLQTEAKDPNGPFTIVGHFLYCDSHPLWPAGTTAGKLSNEIYVEV